MKSTPSAILYWVFTSLVIVIMGVAGVVCIFRMDGVPKVIMGLGYPAYFMTFLGVTDLVGLAVILLPVPRMLREWAYAGFTFNILAAIFSLLSSGHPLVHITDPVIALVAVLGSYFCGNARLGSSSRVGG